VAFALQNILSQRASQAGSAEVQAPAEVSPSAATSSVMAGKKCPECGAHAMIRKDGCEYCTQCGHLGSCG